MVRRLLLLNGLAILGVILFHASGWGFVAMFAWPHRYLSVTSPNYDQVGSLTYYVFRVIEQLAVTAIPAFLFVSGYFIAFATGRNQSTVGWNIVAARIKNLLIPYLIWSFVLLLLYFLEGNRYSPVEYLRLLLTGKTNPAYYYVILLCQFYLISPFLISLARTHWILLLVVAGLIQITVQLLQYPVFAGVEVGALQPLVDVTPKWFFPTRIFWFSFGIVTGFHLQQFKTWATSIKWISLAVLVATVFIGILEFELYVHISGFELLTHRETLVDTFFHFSFLLSFIAFAQVGLPYSKQMGELGAKSYGIYLVHAPVMEYVARAIYHLAPWILAYQILFQPILIGLGLGIPLLLMTAVKRSPARGLCQYLFG